MSPDETTKNQVTIDKFNSSWFVQKRTELLRDPLYFPLLGSSNCNWKTKSNKKGRNKTNTIDLDRLKDPVKIRKYRTKIAIEI